MSYTTNLIRLLLGKRFPFKFIYRNDYWMLDIGKHVFPIKKYRLIYEELLALGAKKENFLEPELAADDDVLLVHAQKYLKKLKGGTLSPAEVSILELPCSDELPRFALFSVGGTILTAQIALEQGLAVHIGGGFHHAYPDHGEGFCPLNDVAVALEKMKKEGKIQKAMVVDCDVHQGNGTAFILQGKDYAFTFSIHQMDIYPAIKPSSSLDVGLWSGDGDVEYLSQIRAYFPRLYQEYRPDVVFYLAGADPYEKDQLGSLRLSIDGLKERDRIVLEEAGKLRIPVAVLLAGGYAVDVNDTVAVHLNTIKVAVRTWRLYS
jgi:acetoin utilization deacetylase AcuC-like enzyme